jgi:hypothetical protein
MDFISFFVEGINMIKIDEQEQNEMNFRSQVVNIEKVGHSRNGNPKFEITIDDMGQERTFTTRADIQVNGISEGSVIDFNISSNGNQITAVEKTDSHHAMTYKMENMEELKNLEFIDKREGLDLAGTIETNIEGVSFEYDGIGDIEFTEEAIEKINELSEKKGLEGNSHMIAYDIEHKFNNSELALEIKHKVGEEPDKFEDKGVYVDRDYSTGMYTVKDKFEYDHGEFETLDEAIDKADEIYIQIESAKENSEIEIEFTDLRDVDAGDLIGVKINGEQVDISMDYGGKDVNIHVVDNSHFNAMAEKLGMDSYELYDFINESFENSELRHDIDTELEENIERLEEYGIEYTNTQFSHMVEHGDEYKTFKSAYEAMEYGNEVLEAQQELMYEAVQSFEPTDRDNPALTSIEFEEVMHDKGIECRNPLASHSLDEVKSMSRDELKEASRSEPERETPDLSRKEEP